MVNIPQASPLCLQISGGAYQQIADTLTIRQLAELPILTIFFFLFCFYHLKPSFSKIITSMAQTIFRSENARKDSEISRSNSKRNCQ